MIRPAHCGHLLFPKCGCVPAPAVATHLIVERDRKLKADAAAEAAKPKKKGRPRAAWSATPVVDPDQEFLDRLPTLVEDPHSRLELLRKVDAEIARNNFSEYCRMAWHVVEHENKLEWNWHHELICQILQGIMMDWERGQADDTFAQRVRNAVFSVPPGSLKSRLLAVFLPTWMWLRNPGWKVICLSVNGDVAMRDARDSRTLIGSEWYQTMFKPDWSIELDQDAISNYANTKGGVRLSKAQGSKIIGLRGDCLLMDDPNDPVESESKLIRDSVNTLYTANIHNRVNHPDKSIRIGIQQRTHSIDWTGYVTSQDGVWSMEDQNPYKWLHVILPAEFEPEHKCVTPWGSDPRTIKGETLHKSRMTPEFLVAERKRFGSHKYAGQMQQRPTLAEGGSVKMRWFRHFHYDKLEMPIAPGDRKGDELDKMHHSMPIVKIHGYIDRWDFDWVVVTLDPASKKTERGSQHGILVIAGKGIQRFVLDDRTFRGDVLEVLAIVEELCSKYDPDRLIIEAKAAGPALMTLFEDKFQRGKIVGSNGRPLTVAVDSIEPQGDKASRLDACLPEMESGLLYLHDGAEWAEAFVGEVCGYPLATYDDRVDALSQALNHMRSWGTYQLPDW